MVTDGDWWYTQVKDHLREVRGKQQPKETLIVEEAEDDLVDVLVESAFSVGIIMITLTIRIAIVTLIR